MSKRQKKLYDHPRSQVPDEPEEDPGEGDSGLAEKEMVALRKKHEAEWKAEKDLSPENMKAIQRRHSQEKADLEFDQENETMPPAPGSDADKAVKAREADRRGTRE